MKVRFFLVLIVAELCVSCSGYEKLPVSTKEIVRLDSLFKVGQINGEKWARSPRDFCMAHFPAISSESNSLYQIDEESNGRNLTTITVREEGGLDDEVIGEQHKLKFEFKEGVWRVTSYEALLKRRE